MVSTVTAKHSLGRLHLSYSLSP